MDRAIVVLSGGLDSAVCLGMAMKKYGAVEAAFVNYGQRHIRERDSSKAVAGHYGVPWTEIRLVLWAGSSAMLAKGDEPEDGTYEDQARDGHVNTEVPFRNGAMLAYLAAMALDAYPDDTTALIIGVHGDDGYAYPDCRPAFMKAMADAVSLGTSGKVRIEAPLQYLTKADIVREGLALGVPFELTWSCYRGGDKACGKCATCLQRREAFRLNGVEDPVEYEAM